LNKPSTVDAHSRPPLHSLRHEDPAMTLRPVGCESDADSAVEVRNIHHRYGHLVVLDGISLKVKRGEFVTLLGQSGSGKTTLLRIIAGLTTPTSGAVSIAGRDVTALAAQHRGVGFVFQNYALFPHLNVFENIAYPLRIRRIRGQDLERRVRAALARIHLPAVGQRYPSELSGGQQQRVAVARALIYEPSVLLLDEPLGALDRKLRRHMQLELRQLHEDLGVTCIYVTHDQEEALTMSDRVVVMHDGRILQVGEPAEVYRRPASGFVADFVGSTNLLEGTITSANPNELVLQSDQGTVLKLPPRTGMAPGNRVRFAVRPEQIELDAKDDKDVHLEAMVKSIVFIGNVVDVTCTLPSGEELVAQYGGGSNAWPAVGQKVRLGWRSDAMNLFLTPDETAPRTTC
jgi:putative spermidine/putrescine transport system ATP-binding protein